MTASRHNLKFAFSSLALLTAIGGLSWISFESRIPSKAAPIESHVATSKDPVFITVSDAKAKTASDVLADKSLEATSERVLSLKEIYIQSAKGSEFSTPAAREVAAFEVLLQKTIDSKYDIERFKEHWQDLGWQISTSQDNSWIIIQELASQRRGRGLYVIRTGAADSIMMQAPHRFFDMQTGTITRKLFEAFPIKAAAWNTVHRKEHDIAHVRESFFNTFTSVIIRNYPDIKNFQIHGFDASKRKSNAPQKTETLAIVSNATRYPNQKTKDFALAMKRAFGKSRVWLFPQETLELGATTNTQASVMRRQGSSNFLHVEMSKTLRDQLSREAAERKKLYRAFQSTTDQ